MMAASLPERTHPLRVADRPIARLIQTNTAITREEPCPDESNLGRPVVLPGGVAGRSRRGRTPRMDPNNGGS